MTNATKGALALESGEVFFGTSFGASGETFGEAVFNTSMSGYQEILTDPSYKKQIIAMTYPEIGNYGVNSADNESDHVHASGFIVHHYSKIVSNFMAQDNLSNFLIKHNTIALEGIDTRKLTRILRITGCQKAVISTIDLDPKSLVEKAKNSPSIVGVDLIKTVTTTAPYDFKYNGQMSPNIKKRHKVAVYDFGIKRNILNCLAQRGCDLTVYPASTKAETILATKPDGVFLSNGPGDPSAVPYIVENVKKIIGKAPIFGICFGHQILGQAYGETTFKLKFGHRGGNQPVKDLTTNKIEISSQNHGFAVSVENKVGLDLSHYNANDKTLEGLQNLKDKAFSVQYHPEASPGPHDSFYLFDRFINFMEK